MPIRDVDGGMIWQGYNPSVFTHKTPKQQPQFYFGGSQTGSNVPVETAKPRGKGITGAVKKYPNIRK